MNWCRILECNGIVESCVESLVGVRLYKLEVHLRHFNQFSTTMEAKLNQFSSLSQKDKGPAFISLISEILSQSDTEVSKDLHTLVDTVVNQDNVGLVVGRQVLSELVKILGEGAIKDLELRKRVVVDTLATVQPRIVSYEEQVSPVSRLCSCESEHHTSGQHFEVSTC